MRAERSGGVVGGAPGRSDLRLVGGVPSAVDQHGAEDVDGEVPALPRAIPVVTTRNGASHAAHLTRKRGPEHDEIEVARVVCDVDPLACGGLAADPAGLRAGDESGQSDDCRGDHGALPSKSRSAAEVSGRTTIDGRAARRIASASPDPSADLVTMR